MNYRSILTVVTPAADPSLVDVAVVKDELNVTTSATDARLTRWIKEESSTIQSSLDRVLRQEVVSETFRALGYSAGYPLDPHGERFYARDGWNSPGRVSAIRLRRYPVTAIASITEDTITLDPALPDYEFEPETGLVFRLSGTDRIPWSGQVVVITYTAGYNALTDVPGDLAKGCLLMVKHRWTSQTRDPMLRQQNVPGVLEQSFTVAPVKGPLGLLPDVEDLIGHYRDVHL